MRTKSPNTRSPLEATDNQAVRQSPPSVPAMPRFRELPFASGAGREDPCFFKMLMALFLYFCFSFVILVDKFRVTCDSKRNSTKGKNFWWKAAFSIFHAPWPSSRAPLAPRHTPLDLSSPGISRTSWILRIFNKFFIFESFCRALCETLPNSWFCILNKSYYYNCHLVLGFLLTGCSHPGGGQPLSMWTWVRLQSVPGGSGGHGDSRLTSKHDGLCRGRGTLLSYYTAK